MRCGRIVVRLTSEGTNNVDKGYICGHYNYFPTPAAYILVGTHFAEFNSNYTAL